jgi:hypothetical protein
MRKRSEASAQFDRCVSSLLRPTTGSEEEGTSTLATRRKTMANPVYQAFVVANPPEGSDRKPRWTEIGVVFENKGEGLTLTIRDQISVAGRIILMPWKEQAERPAEQPEQRRSGPAPRGPR